MIKTQPLLRSLVVSIHDVSPRTREQVESMLQDLSEWGVTHTSLLVIPDHHRKGHFLQSPEFCDWLRKKADSGHEVVVHGYYHQRPVQTEDKGWRKLVTQFYTAGEGEFFDLGEAEALDRAQRASGEFAKANLPATGFIAPAWLLGTDAERGIRRANFEYTTRLTNVSDLKLDATYYSQSLVYSVRSEWRRRMSLLWNAWLFTSLSKKKELLRLGLHPPDRDFPEIWEQIHRLVVRALDDREPITYQTWMQKWRARR